MNDLQSVDGVRIHLLTWNVYGTKPLPANDLSRLCSINPNVDIYAVCLQEIPSGVRETVYSYMYYDEWAEQMLSVFSKRSYYLVESVRLQGISLSVFAHIDRLPFITFIKVGWKRTGFGGYWGNKGGVAVSCNIYGKRVCFLNVHLAAHVQFNEARVQQFHSIVDEMEFDGNATILSHDLLFVGGDLNFRIMDLSSERIQDLITQQRYSELLDCDQLQKQLKFDHVFKLFTEGAIQFPPSYKYRIGSDHYDVSKASRPPAWTDRILFRVNPEISSVSAAMKNLSLSSLSTENYDSSDDDITLVSHSYRILMEFQQSDHKPVVASFDIKVLKNQRPMVDVKASGPWIAGSTQIVSIVYDKDYESNVYDYLALYEGDFFNYRSYKSWAYVPFERTDELAKAAFPIDEFVQGDSFRLGFYSTKMSCLLALTKPFKIIRSPALM